jgi:hypothetical protein
MFGWIKNIYNNIFMNPQSEDILLLNGAPIGEINWESFQPFATVQQAQNQHIFYIPEINPQALQAVWPENQVSTFGDVTDNESNAD